MRMRQTFRLAAAALASILLTVPVSAADASKSPQAAAYQTSLKAIASGDFEAYKKSVTKAARAGIEKDMKEMGMDAKKGMEMLKEMAPSDIKYTAVKVDGKKATLSATGKMMDEPQYGTIELEEEDGAWKVGHQSWTNKKP
ncbi:MAG: hypothetical protein ABW056_03785 [Thermoanaerobaculia bacterium]